MRISDWSSDVCSSDLSFNYTKSNANYPSVVAGATYSLEGLSKYSYSLVGYYEKYGIQARVAYTYRDDFLQTAVGRNSEQEYFNGYGQLDASLSYDLTDNFTVLDRKSVVSGKSVSVRVDIGGRGIIKKNTQHKREQEVCDHTMTDNDK